MVESAPPLALLAGQLRDLLHRQAETVSERADRAGTDVAAIAGEDGCTLREALRRLREGCRTLPDSGRAIPLPAGT